MILGLGTDILDIQRFKKTLETYEQQALDRLFTPTEQAYCNAKSHLRISRFAKRFAAKEAALKAMGTGRSQGIKWTDVYVENNCDGKPELVVVGKASEVLETLTSHKPFQTHISLADSEDFAIATVIIEVL